MSSKLSSDSVLYLASGVAIAAIIAATHFSIENKDKKNNIASLQTERSELIQKNNNLSAELAAASSSIAELSDKLQTTKEDLDDLADNFHDEKNKNDEFEDQIRGLADTLGDLDKLAKIDEELLSKYSKVYFLNENYTPSKVEKIPSKYILDGKDEQYFHTDASEYLEDMFKAAARDDIDLKVVSAYRSFYEQTDLKGQYTQVYGSGANAFSADQGYSEHQLGTTLDLTVDSVGGPYTIFKDTEAYNWLLKNAYKYGFILSYPEGNSFYVYEPWHWRFVGTNLARHINRNDESFYEMDQRDINEYLLELFD